MSFGKFYVYINCQSVNNYLHKDRRGGRGAITVKMYNTLIFVQVPKVPKVLMNRTNHKHIELSYRFQTLTDEEKKYARLK